MENENVRTVILHGFTNQEALAVMRAVKAASPDPGEIAFAVSTPNSIEMKLGDILADLAEEHRHFRKR